MPNPSSTAAFRTFPVRRSFPVATLLALVFAFPQLLDAQPMVMTDILGRSITAEPVALEGDKLTIRRDDGRVFDLSLANLSDEDQARIREWKKTADEAPAPRPSNPPPAAQAKASDDSASTPKPPSRNATDPQKIEVSLSRFKAGTRVLAKFEGYAHQHESWGYGLQISNRNLYPAENVRIEYNMFARPMPEITNPTVVTGAFDLPPIASGRSESVRTRTAEVCKRKGYWVYNNGGELRGIWVKVFLDGKLVQEQVSPESLRNEESWSDPAKSPAVRTPAPTYIY